MEPKEAKETIEMNAMKETTATKGTTEAKKDLPRISGTLRAKAIHMPEVIRRARGMVVLGRRIKSLIFSTDLAIIRNCDADAVLAVYPFTPQQVISRAIIDVSSIPVFVGVGGGTTKGVRSAIIAQDAEAQGAFGVVVNAPMNNANIRLIHQIIDIPVIATIVNEKEDIQARLDAGVRILNVSAGPATADVVNEIRKKWPDVPIIATGGRTEKNIEDTILAGANSISYTPPSTGEIFTGMMASYRAQKENDPFEEEERRLSTLEELMKIL